MSGITTTKTKNNDSKRNTPKQPKESGRPFSAYETSRLWLDRHGLRDVPLYCLDKYGRENGLKNCRFSLSLSDYYRMKFDVAVEDSPLAYRFFDHLPVMSDAAG